MHIIHLSHSSESYSPISPYHHYLPLFIFSTLVGRRSLSAWAVPTPRAARHLRRNAAFPMPTRDRARAQPSTYGTSSTVSSKLLVFLTCPFTIRFFPHSFSFSFILTHASIGMGFSDKEIVALLGAHALGRCHTDRSGYWGPWTFAENTFSNEYFRLLVEERWSPKVSHNGKPWEGPDQFEDSTGKLMMLPR
jgi:hypothetical protein